jgi:hypothetical protein
MRASLLFVVLGVSVTGAAHADEVKRISAPEALVKAPKTVARRFLTGQISHDSTVETFTLQRVGDDALLTVESVRAENNGDKIGTWVKLSLVQYLGTATTEGDVITIKVSNKPLSQDLTCKKEKIEVAAATAVRGRDPTWAGQECGDPGRWEPPATSKVEVLHCVPTPAPSDSGPDEPAATDHLGFAPGPGVEWLYVNDDCVIQGGGWRKVGAKSSIAAVRGRGAAPKKK